MGLSLELKTKFENIALPRFDDKGGSNKWDYDRVGSGPGRTAVDALQTAANNVSAAGEDILKGMASAPATLGVAVLLPFLGDDISGLRVALASLATVAMAPVLPVLYAGQAVADLGQVVLSLGDAGLKALTGRF